MSISDLIMYIIGIFLFGVLVSRTIESVKRNNYERKRKKIAKKLKKAMDEHYAQRNDMKSSEEGQDVEEIDEADDIVEQEEIDNFMEEANEAGFDIDKEEALQYILDGKSPEDYVTYMEDFYQGDDDISDDSDDNSKEKAEDYINDMSGLGYDITDDDANEMADEGFDPEDYAEEYDEEDRDDL